MTANLYEGLDISLQQIRLIQLESAIDRNDPLVATLRTVSLLDRPNSRALSYVCGDVESVTETTLSGRVVPVLRTLDAALRDVRSPKNSLTIRTDQLSINQQDSIEKSHQIPLMAAIYDAAIAVTVYISDQSASYPTARSSRTRWTMCETIRSLGKLRKDQHLKGHTDGQKCMDALQFYVDHYWTRDWTIQEFILAKRIVYKYGAQTLSEHIVEGFYDWCAIHIGKRRCCLTGTMADRLEMTEMMTLAAQRFSTTRDIKSKERSGYGSDLLDLLDRTRHRRVLRPHDKLFALAGLASIPGSLVNYDVSAELTFERTTVHRIQSTGTLHVLERLDVKRWQPEQSNTARCRSVRMKDLASWCPDWSLEYDSIEAGRLNDKLTLYSLHQSSTMFIPPVMTTDSKWKLWGARRGVIASVGACYDVFSVFRTQMVFSWATLAGVTWNDLLNLGHPNETRLRFVLALTRGIGVSRNGSFYLMRKREHYVPFEQLSARWWHSNLQQESTAEVSPQTGRYALREEGYPDHHVSQFHDLVRNSCHLHCFAILDDGSFGYVPPTALSGDIVCDLQGGRTSFVLGAGKRKWQSRTMETSGTFANPLVECRSSTPEEHGCFHLLGDAYFEGLKYGLATASPNNEDEEFVLV